MNWSWGMEVWGRKDYGGKGLIEIQAFIKCDYQSFGKL